MRSAEPHELRLAKGGHLPHPPIFGRNGTALSSTTVHRENLPADVPSEQIERETVDVLSELLTRLFPHFAARSAITAPAVLAGLGVAAHQATAWGSGTMTLEGLLNVLADVRWEREARYWEDVAARSGAPGSLNFGGGAKDAGGRVADALLSPASSLGRQIRGLQ